MCDLTAPHFKDEEKAREYLEALRWPNGPVCPHCGNEGGWKLEGKSTRPGLYKCVAYPCREQFTVTVGTVFERSKIPLTKWLMAVHLMCASKKGISSHQLHRMLGVTYKTAWFMSHRLRIWNRNERALPIKPEIQHTAAQLLEPLYEDEGSIEGTLEVLSGHGRLEVVVYDPLDGRAIKCELSPEDMRSALDNFMRRVEVFGKIRYRRDGMAVSVKVDEIIPFPRSEEIPSLDQVRGILRN